MYLRTLEIWILKYMILIYARFVTAPGLALQAALKKTKVKLDLLFDVDMLLMVGKGVLEEEYLTLLINMQRLIRNT